MNLAENYILKQSQPFQSILLQLQVIIESTLPTLDLKYKWKLPFYYYKNKPFCYFNVSKEYVDIGLVKGTQNQDNMDVLITKDRKKMASLRYYRIQDIDVKVLISVLKNASELY